MAKRKANDRPRNVQIEIRAAELASGNQPLIWETHGAADHVVDISGRLATVSTASLAFLDWWSGWLWSELRTHDARDERDADAWPWDPSRPVAGQYEEHQAHLTRGDAQWDEAPEVDPAALLAAIPELTTAELDQPEPPPVVAEAIEKIAEVVGDEDGDGEP